MKPRSKSSAKLTKLPDAKKMMKKKKKMKSKSKTVSMKKRKSAVNIKSIPSNSKKKKKKSSSRKGTLTQKSSSRKGTLTSSRHSTSSLRSSKKGNKTRDGLNFARFKPGATQLTIKWNKISVAGGILYGKGANKIEMFDLMKNKWMVHSTPLQYDRI